MATGRPPLTPQSAEITTATVEIKALTVNGKQVTLAVFRQLYEQPLFNTRTWKAHGTPWCRVNYHPDRCDRDDIPHEHVVWQKGDELRRARINEPSDDLDAIPRFDKAPEDELAVCVAAGAIGNARIKSVKGAGTSFRTAKTPVQASAAYVAATFDKGRYVEAKLHLSSPQAASIVAGFGDQPHPSLHSEHERLHPSVEDCARIAQILTERLRWAEDWVSKAFDRWEEIRDLPQVFIAL